MFYDGEEEVKGAAFCARCRGEFPEIGSPLCPVCGRPFVSESGEDHWCEACMRKPPAYDALRAPFLFDGLIMEAIHKFKYGPRPHLGRSLGPLLADFADKWTENLNGLLVFPVPLHPRRLRERGFNQSLILARHVAARLGGKLDFMNLRRTRHTRPQTGLGRDDRKKNVRRAFGLEDPAAVKKCNALLIDDVATTGNTLNECAGVLKRAGCESVRCLVLARAADR